MNLLNLLLVGMNHKTAPVEVRERLAIPESRLGEAARHLAGFPGVEEGMVLSTCNRVELLACFHSRETPAEAAAGNGSRDLRRFLRDFFQVEERDYEPYLYEYRDREALRHLFRVAASLDSLVVGEPQILGQVKEAYAAARAAGALHSRLEAAVSRALVVAKRVRSETALGASAVSIASAAVELAKKIFGSLQGKQVYLVGAGKMSELAARHLLAHGAAAIFVSNRTHQRACELARRFGGEAILFEQLYDTVDRADIVITSTGAPHAIFRRQHGEIFLARRRNRPMFFIDIAVPRDVDPEMNNLDGIFVYDIDDLQSVVAVNLADRQREAERAEAIIEEEVERFSRQLQTLVVVPTIASLQDHLENIRQAEIERVRGRLGSLTPEQHLAIEAMTRGIINKVLHTPVTTLKMAAREAGAPGPDVGPPGAEVTTLIELVRRIFNLSEKKS